MNVISNSRLLIFSRFPVSGKAKTRLIPALGPDGAAQLHRFMTESAVNLARSTYSLSPESVCGVTVYCTGAKLKDFRTWLGSDLQYKTQSSGNLGQRMQDAFKTTFAAGIKNAIGIGTDAPELSSVILLQAHQSLDSHDIVLGPAADGGYYLIGMNSFHPELFVGVDWGTEHVHAQTVEICTRLDLRVAELPILNDVDRPEDLDTLRKDPRFNGIVNKGRNP